MRCRPGEPGILLGRVRRVAEFDGYRDRRATSEKILRDVFRAGDAWFDTGDLLRMDWRRNLYFVDRLGDTFRYKGENVSTFEVQEQIGRFSPVVGVNAYGVQIPGVEGRAGMVAIVLREGAEFDPEAFGVHVDSHLAAYARPLFVRIEGTMRTTGTLKLRKAELQNEGFDRVRVSDPIYFRDPRTGRYTALDAERHSEILAGRLRL
jgi:acyl-CoA synthetase (AMP-forming)/AMP-acid ligase II